MLLSEGQVESFLTGSTLEPESQARGRRGAFFVHSSLTLPPDSQRAWHVVADIDQGPSRLAGLLGQIREGVAPEAIEADIDAGAKRLQQLVGGADGFQLTSDVLTTARIAAIQAVKATPAMIPRPGRSTTEVKRSLRRTNFLDFRWP